jgi:ankyrin repeat protein
LGANPNCQDIQGNTPLHLAVESLLDEPENFEKAKNIAKELIFSGASRDIKNN